ncbi:MAG: hypothetical protein KBC12_01595 [Candidatus Pacebacteria bacterium]|nr:hypothetical protein [Candidatus Paceibacterota bacterium]
MKKIVLFLIFVISISSLFSCATGNTGGWSDARQHQKTSISRHRVCGATSKQKKPKGGHHKKHKKSSHKRRYK